MEMEIDPRVKTLPYKIKGMSRESSSQKAVHLLDADLRNYWSTGSNTKEWILLELEEPALLSHIHIYNKSVLEWEISVGLRYKPEAFTKVRPRCEAPRRDMMYPMNFTPCRYVRIFCLRGNPIAIFFIQLAGVTVTGLEPDFQPVVTYLLPNIISHKQDLHDMHLQLLQDVTKRLQGFLPQLEGVLTSFPEEAESNTRFLAMLAGPFYPMLHIVNEREASKSSGNSVDSDTLRNNQASMLTVSSNFEIQPRRSRSPSVFVQPASSTITFRADVVFMLLRRAYKDSHLGNICRMVSRVLYKIMSPDLPHVGSILPTESTSISDATLNDEPSYRMHFSDYSSLFGEEFKIFDDNWDVNLLNLLDISAVEEGVLHVLYACASQPLLCAKLSEHCSNFWSTLPLVQALLPALRPSIINLPDQLDESFGQWSQLYVQYALSQIVQTSASPAYCALVHSCAGYLSSYSPSHMKAACILVDLCFWPLAPWLSTIIAKVDLAIELLEDLLGIIECSHPSARAALKYIVLALSGQVDDILPKYKEVKHKLLFIIEMLEPFLAPALTSTKGKLAFGIISPIFSEEQESNCRNSLKIIDSAVHKPAVLQSLEFEWRKGSVPPSVLLSILDPHLTLPPEIDNCKCSSNKLLDQTCYRLTDGSLPQHHSQDEFNVLEPGPKIDTIDDASSLFVSPYMKNLVLSSSTIENSNPNGNSLETRVNEKRAVDMMFNDKLQNDLILDTPYSIEHFNLLADTEQLLSQDCEHRASEFQRLALELHSHPAVTLESHEAAVDALLLAAECYVNPFFKKSFISTPESFCPVDTSQGIIDLKKICHKIDFQKLKQTEKNRDKAVVQILLQAAQLDKDFHREATSGDISGYNDQNNGQSSNISPLDVQFTDAVTLIRQNQAVLCRFLVQRLRRGHCSMHEILIQSLLFLLHSSTQLFCHPGDVIDIIIGSAEQFSVLLSSLYCKLKDHSLKLKPEEVYGVRRHWLLLQGLVIACSGDGGGDYSINFDTGLQYRCLVPLLLWIQRIPNFSNSSFPIVRFLGWMAIARYAKVYIKEKMYFVSELTQLTSLLSIFVDDLAMIENIINKRVEDSKLEKMSTKKADYASRCDNEGSFNVLYPGLHFFLPNMKRQYGAFEEVILEAVCLQLKSIPSTSVPDALCWFSDLCLWRFHGAESNHQSNNPKVRASSNAKAIILYILEAIVVEHMESMVPEIPRVIEIILSLCKSSYCDVSFIDAVLHLLKPLISYSVKRKGSNNVVVRDHKQNEMLVDESFCHDFESLCFDKLLSEISGRIEHQVDSSIKEHQAALLIFVLGALIPDMSCVRRMEVLKSLVQWADFSRLQPLSLFYDYLCAFESVIGGCKIMLLEIFQVFDIIVPFEEPSTNKLNGPSFSSSEKVPLDSTVTHDISFIPRQEFHSFSDDINKISDELEPLIMQINQSLELCWEHHNNLSKELALSSARCYMYLKFLLSLTHSTVDCISANDEEIIPTSVSDQISIHWRNALENLAEIVMILVENHCWQVASTVVDYILNLPHDFPINHVVSTLCYAIKHFCTCAPRISWRLQTGEWLWTLVNRGLDKLRDSDASSFVDLFTTMLGHSEPEQQSIALQILSKLVGLDIYCVVKFSHTIQPNLDKYNSVISVQESFVSVLVSNMWDTVASLATSDPSLLIRTHSKALLSGFIPFATRSKLQSLLVAADVVIHGLGNPHLPLCQGTSTRLSLILLASACLFSPTEDISLIPQSAWSVLEEFRVSTKKELFLRERMICEALCKVRDEGNVAKENLKGIISSNSVMEYLDPEFRSTRESILQVLATLTSVQTNLDFFSKKADKEAMELEEAEIERELLLKETIQKEVLPDMEDCKGSHSFPLIFDLEDHSRKDNRLTQIKDEIRSLERSKILEEITTRRQKKLLFRHSRQKLLEEADLREAELLQELDRLRTQEVEQEFDRQKTLELERTKTRELRHNLDIERERQTQRELQRELEQVESGIRSRREFSSSGGSRGRDKHNRERENGRSGHDGSSRVSSTSHDSTILMQSNAPATVLTGSRAFPGQPPVILQSRERLDDRSGGYDDNVEGSRDSGDASSIGDPDLGSAFDGLPNNFVSSHRHGSRGIKSRQTIERREREGRREGKWERKH